MRTRFAIAGATILGVAIATLTANSAQAVPTPATTTPCADVNGHTGADTFAPNWYGSCVPQYGMGKAEFTISSDVDFPSDFKDLTDSSVTAVSSVDTTGAPTPEAYFQLSAPVHGASGLQRINQNSNNSRIQDYTANLIFRIAGVQAAAVSDLSAACDTANVTYTNVYKVNYVPTTNTYTQTTADGEWKFVVNVAPQPLFIGLGSNANAGSPLCLVEGTSTIKTALGATDQSYGPEPAQLRKLTPPSGAVTSSISPFLAESTNGISMAQAVGNFPRSVASSVTAPTQTTSTSPADPTKAAVPHAVLAATGTDPMPAIWAGGILMLLGAGALTVTSRRSRNSRSA